MEKTAPPPASPLGALRTLADQFLGSVQDRLELFALELQGEKLRLLGALVWLAAALFTGALALVFASLTAVYLLWEYAPLAALGGGAVFFALACGVAAVLYRRRLRRLPRPFAGTIAELMEDRKCIRPGS